MRGFILKIRRYERHELGRIARDFLHRDVTPTPDDIAAKAGISRATYYRTVGSHRQLLAEAGLEEADSSRERILAAALQLINEVGISGVNMDTVASQAGTSRATLYRLFPNKASLLAELARSRSPLHLLGVALKQAPPGDPAEMLRQLFTASVPRIINNRGVLRAILAEATLAGPETGEGRSIIAEVYRDLADYLQRQMDAGRMRRMNVLVAVQSLVGPILFYATVRPDLWSEVAPVILPPDKVVAEMLDVWLRGMQPDAPPLADRP